MKKTMVLIIALLFLPYLSRANDNLENHYRDKFTAINQVNEQYESTVAGGKSMSIIEPMAISFWPSTHAADAVRSIFYRGYGSSKDSFYVYVWRENRNTWLEVVPLHGEPFVCSSSFSIIKNSIQYDDIKLETRSGTSQCDDVYTSSIYKLTSWSFVDNPPNLSGAFALYFDGGETVYSLSVPVSNPIIPNSNETYYIPYFDLLDGNWTGVILNNTSSQTANIGLRYYDNTGNLVHEETKTIPPHGQDLSFPTLNTKTNGWVEISSSQKLAGTALIGSSSTLYEVDLKSSLHKTFTITHLYANSSSLKSTIMLCNPNPDSSGCTVALRYFSKDGNSLNSFGRYVVIKNMGSAQINLYELFDKTLEWGSIVIDSSLPINAFMLFDGTGTGNNWKIGWNALPSD